MIDRLSIQSYAVRMEFALLGAQPYTADLVQAFIDAGHSFVWLDAAAASDDAIRKLAGNARTSEAWEELLDRGNRAPAGVIVSRGADEELRAEQLRKLTQVGAPVLVLHPVVLSMLVYYELDMIRGDSGAVLRHCTPWVSHPFVSAAKGLVQNADSSIGRCEQIVLERMSDDRSEDATHEWIVRDVALIHELCGTSKRVIAMGSQAEDRAGAITSLQTTSAAGMTVRWSLASPDPVLGAKLTIVGEHGKATVSMIDRTDWQWQLVVKGDTVESRTEPAGLPSQAMEQFVAAIAGDDDGQNWQVATQTMNVVDAAARSLARGRAIELHDEEASEHSTFKGIMSALGCALVLFVPAVLLLAGFLGDTVGIGGEVVELWPVAILVVLGIFLVLQLLPLLVFPRSPQNRPRR